MKKQLKNIKIKMDKCPICQRQVRGLMPILNPGKGYQHSCKKCVEVAMLITQNYPYTQPWYKEGINIDALKNIINYDGQLSSINIENGKILGSEAISILKKIRLTYIDILTNDLKNFVAIDAIVILSIIFSQLSQMLCQPKKMRLVLASWGIEDADYALLQIDSLCSDVIMLQNLVIKFGSNKIKSQRPDKLNMLSLLRFVKMISYIATLEDSIYYLSDFAGFVLINNEMYPVNDNLEIIDNKDMIKANSLNDSIDDAANLFADKSAQQDIVDEFYSFPFLLDTDVLLILGFTITDLFQSYIGLASFADKFNGLFVMTPCEFNELLSEILHTNDTTKIHIISKYLLCDSSSAMTETYQLSCFYTPIYAVPLGNYEMYVLNSSIINYARVNFFHDIVYGTNAILLKNETLHVKYTELKQTHITAPFENKVAEVFKKLGWNVILNAKGGLSVEKKLIVKIPDIVGEIDIIGLSPNSKYIVVADCKYIYDYGANAKETKSLKQRFDGKKSYFNQIDKKHKWVDQNINALLKVFYKAESHSDVLSKAIIITRNRLILDLSNDEIEVVPIADLEKLLSILEC